MTARLVITGTDTGVGKTVFAAGLARLLNASYWKPVQAGLERETDSETVAHLAQVPPAHLLPEAYRLKTPASPHFAAERDGIAIEPERLALPSTTGPLVIEGAGGLMVPLSRDMLFIELFAQWRLPVILCARTSLGTINHTLLSIAALKSHRVPLLGVAFVGVENADTQNTIAEFGKVRVLGRLPLLDPLTPEALSQAMQAQFGHLQFETLT